MAKFNASSIEKFFGVKGKAEQAIFGEYKDIWSDIVDEVIEYILAHRTFHDITGNLLNSMGVAVYRNGKRFLQRAVTKRRPIAAPLDEGEALNVEMYPVYYDGRKNTGYRGQTPLTSKSMGNDLRQEAFDQGRNKSGYGSNTCKIYVFAAMDYADYVATKNHRVVLGNLSEELGDIVARNIIKNLGRFDG